MTLIDKVHHERAKESESEREGGAVKKDGKLVFRKEWTTNGAQTFSPKGPPAPPQVLFVGLIPSPKAFQPLFFFSIINYFIFNFWLCLCAINQCCLTFGYLVGSALFFIFFIYIILFSCNSYVSNPQYEEENE